MTQQEKELKKLILSAPTYYISDVEVIRKSDLDRIVEELTKWNKVEDSTPLAYESGDWDGLRSDIVLAKDTHGYFHTARVYEGVLDGFKFCDFFDEHDYEIDGIIEWKQII